MLSKFMRPLRDVARASSSVLNPKRNQPALVSVRRFFDVPPTQYDVPVPNKLRLIYALKVYWEIIPLFLTTGFSLCLLFGSIIWAFSHKVDTVFTSRSRDNISRTMDLRNPSVHKLLIINQRYEPWPEMQDVLDKMRMTEKRTMMRARSCTLP